MASQGEAVSASVAVVAEQDTEKPSPSQSLLQRLKNLREWQERQREELMQVLSHSQPSKGPFLTPLKEETPENFHECTVTDDSMTPRAAPHRVEGPPVTVGIPGAHTASSVLQQPVNPPENFPAVVEAQLQQEDQVLGSRDVHVEGVDPLGIKMTQTDHPTTPHEGNEWPPSPASPPQPSLGYTSPEPQWNEPGGDERSAREATRVTSPDAGTEGVTPDAQPASLSPEEPRDFMDESVEQLFGTEKHKLYRSEKYKCSAPSRECLGRAAAQAAQAEKKLMLSKSFFCTMSQVCEDSAEDVREAPRPRHRFLRKGQGTSRFGMKPMRLKKTSNTETVDECSFPPHEAIKSNGEASLAAAPPVPALTKRQFRLPVQNLKLQEAPQRVAAAVGESTSPVEQPVHGSVRHRASPALPCTHPTPRGPARPLLGPRDLDRQQRKEEEELSAFEKLEELADDSSFSSNSSTVWQLLKQGQQSVSSTPVRTPPPLAFQETPVVASWDTEPESLAGESHFLVGDLIHRVLSPKSGKSPRQARAAVDVKEVLAQLRSIVRLEGHSISDITESDIQSFLEGCSSQYPSHPPHPTSTPALPPPHPSVPQLYPSPQGRPHHVHFASEGVQVLEYELSDTEGEDTLTEATSLDSDLITTSDLEALTQLNVQGGYGVPLRQQQQTEPPGEGNEDDSSSSDVTLTEQEAAQGQDQMPVVLTFSPPPPRPVQSASNYIWSIFGKERDAKKQSAPKAPPKQANKVHRQPQHESQEEKSVTSAPQPHPDEASRELDVHKTLLLAKVAELEKETNLFKRENSKLQRLQQQLQEEREKLEKEKHKLQGEAATERRKFQEYVDRERNALWTEKQQIFQRPAVVTQPQEHTMEVVRLREQLRLSREEAERTESMNRCTVNRLNDRIKALENENKKLKEKNNSLQALEKENQDLKFKMDRGRVGGRAKAGTQPSKPTQGRAKPGTKCTTVGGVVKALEKMSKPQPAIVKEAQHNPSKTKQDLVNNNLNLGVTQPNKDAMAEQRSNAETESSPAPASAPKDMPGTEGSPAPPPAGPPRHSQQVPMWASLGCTEEAGLEHTERLRDDGIREVIYANGNRKEIHPSGDVTISFYNGDRKEIRGDRTVYVYGSDRTSHTTYATGEEELVFPNGQRETRHPDGSSEISFPNGSRKSVLGDGTEICTTKDGSVVRTNPDGSQVFEFPSGQREVHQDGEKRREYPDGTVKILHPDGRAETRYSSGRIRIKDREGNVILDTHTPLSPPLPS